MRRILRFFKGSTPTLIMGMICTILVIFIELTQTQMMATIINQGIKTSDMSVVWNTGLIMLGLAILGMAFGIGSTTLASLVSNKFAARMRDNVYEKIQRFSLKKTSKYTTGTLVTRLSTDVDFLQRTVMFGLRLLVRSPIMLVSSVLIIWQSDYRLAYIVLFFVVFLTFGIGIIIRLGFRRFKVLQTKVDKLNQHVQESLINIRVIKSFVREKFENKRFKETNDDLRDYSIYSFKLMNWIDPIMMFSLNFATVIIMWVAAQIIVKEQSIQVGDLLVFMNYLRFTLFSMMMLTMMFNMFSRAKASIDRINEVLDEEIDIQSPQVNAIHLNEIEGKIEFENVDFKYFEDNEQYILENINFTVLPGQQLGIIGSTGSGKSTLVYLLARLIDPIKGMIKVDGVNIKEMDLDQLRSSIGFVLQKNVLFTGSVAHNLRWGDQSATQETLDWAAEISNIKEFIDGQEAGYDYEIQQGGSNLSGGQRQRMCLARALVIKPKILVLDDSTSALDSQTEKQINEAFKEKLQGTTIVNIAQKISSIAHCDQILVLDEGKLVGKGTHNQLLETCQVYQEIYASQLKKGGDFDVAQ